MGKTRSRSAAQEDVHTPSYGTEGPAGPSLPYTMHGNGTINFIGR